jgi:hypothetical protein
MSKCEKKTRREKKKAAALTRSEIDRRYEIRDEGGMLHRSSSPGGQNEKKRKKRAHLTRQTDRRRDSQFDDAC